MSDSRNVPVKNRVTGKNAQSDQVEAKSVPKSDVTYSGRSLHADNIIDVQAEKETKNVSTDSGDMNRPAKGEKIQSNQAGKGSGIKAKKDIKDLAEFIAYAYSRKGQGLSLKPKVEKAICDKPRLGGELRQQLLELAKEDMLLAVPRQILLTLRNIVGYPTLKSEVRSFINDVLIRHPAFSTSEIEGTLNNLENAPGPRSALVALAATDYSKLPDLAREKPLKPKDYESLRANAVYTLALWFSETRALSPEKLNQYLFETLWQPQALTAKDETARLQALTNIRDLAGVGMACLGFKHQADQQMRIADSAKRAEESAVERLQSLKISNEEIQHNIEERDRKISKLHEALETEKQAHERTRVHLNDDLEHLRSRLLRRLKAEVSLLDEGLHALRRDPPKIRVMEDHAERTLDGLKREIKELGSNE